MNGRYDNALMALASATEADAVVCIIVNGKNGDSYSCNMKRGADVRAACKAIRAMIERMEAEAK